MATPKLPKTQARLSTSATIRLIPEDKLTANVLSDPTALSNMVLQATPIGAVESFSEMNNRPAFARFEMNAAAPGVVLEVLPGLVEARKLTLRRVALYTGDIMDTFSIEGDDVVFQFAPFALIKVETSPQGAGVPNRYTLFSGCWFTSNPKAFNLTNGDIKIIQEVNITYAERQIVDVAPM